MASHERLFLSFDISALRSGVLDFVEQACPRIDGSVHAAVGFDGMVSSHMWPCMPKLIPGSSWRSPRYRTDQTTCRSWTTPVPDLSPQQDRSRYLLRGRRTDDVDDVGVCGTGSRCIWCTMQYLQSIFVPAHASATSFHEPHFSCPICLSSIFSHAGPPKAPVPRHCRSCKMGYGPIVSEIFLSVLGLAHRTALARLGAAIPADSEHMPWRTGTGIAARPWQGELNHCHYSELLPATCAGWTPVTASIHQADLSRSGRRRRLTDW